MLLKARAHSHRVDQRRRYAAVLAGRYDQAELEPPLLDDKRIIEIVRAMLARTGRPPLANPIHHLVRDGLRPIDRSLSGVGHEATDGTTVWYRWTSDVRELGRRVKHGHAHALLFTEDHNEADAILTTAELAVPTCVLSRYASAEDAVRDAHHSPIWLVQQQFERRRAEIERFFLVS